jgi:hypothetical protein
MHLSTQKKSNFGNYIVVDFSKPSTDKRLFIYDSKGNLLFSTYTSHGRGSGLGTVAVRFGNIPGSNRSSIGVYRLAESYIGRHGKSIRLDGISNTNSNARKRLIVIHPASYIGSGRTGTSLGCFTIPEKDVYKVYSLIESGNYLYAKR